MHLRLLIIIFTLFIKPGITKKVTMTDEWKNGEVEQIEIRKRQGKTENVCKLSSR